MSLLFYKAERVGELFLSSCPRLKVADRNFLRWVLNSLHELGCLHFDDVGFCGRHFDCAGIRIKIYGQIAGWFLLSHNPSETAFAASSKYMESERGA